MANYNYLDPIEEDALHGPRLLNFEEKNLKRLIKRVSEISSQCLKSSEISSEFSEDILSSTRQGWKNEIFLDFANFDSNVVRAQLVLNSNQQERARYAAEKIRIEETAKAVKDNNAVLHEQLGEARETLEVRKGWDKLTEKITSNKALKSRDEQRLQLEKLNTEIEQLQAEGLEYARTWAERREQFGKIVDEGTQLLRLIRDEKEEAERKEGMEDTEEEGSSTPVRTDRSRAGTPGGSATPAHQNSRLRDEVLVTGFESKLDSTHAAAEESGHEDTGMPMDDTVTPMRQDG